MRNTLTLGSLVKEAIMRSLCSMLMLPSSLTHSTPTCSQVDASGFCGVGKMLGGGGGARVQYPKRLHVVNKLQLAYAYKQKFIGK